MKKITCLFLNLSAIMIFFFCGVKLCAQSYTYDKDVYENSAELYVNGDKDLKACDSNGKVYTIDDYKTLFGSNVVGSKLEKKYNVLSDDPIINVIPRYYFNHECEYYSDGEQYFFYIKTSKRKGTLNNCIGGKSGNYFINEVLYVSYKTSLEQKNNVEFLMDEEQKDTFSYTMEVHQFRFFTVDVSKEGAYLPSVFSTMNEVSFSKYLLGKDVVIPMPINKSNGYTFEESDFHYKIDNIVTNSTIINTHTEDNDRGLFFTGSVISDTATKYYTSNENFEDEDYLLDIVGGLLSLIPTKLNTIYTVGAILIKTQADMRNVCYKERLNEQITTKSIIENNLNLLWSNKSEQIKKGGLIKNYMMSRRDLFLQKDSMASFGYIFSYDTTDENLLGAIVNTYLIYDVYFDADKKVSIKHSFNQELCNNDFLETISEDDNISGFNYKMTKNKYIFTPLKTSIYDFNVSNNQKVFIYKDNIKIRNSNLLKANEEYRVEVINDTLVSTYYELKINPIEKLGEVLDEKVSENDSEICLELKFKNINKYQVVVDIYGVFDILENGYCTINLNKQKLYNNIDYFGFIPKMYINSIEYGNIPILLDDSLNLYVRNQNFIVEHNKEIYSTIMNIDGYYNINTEFQFLALFYNFVKDNWISYDDGINDDPYIIGDSHILSFVINRNLDFENFNFKVPNKIYLYGQINGNNYVISNLILNSAYEYFYVENYGSIENIIFQNVSMKSIFEYGSTYGSYKNIVIKEE